MDGPIRPLEVLKVYTTNLAVPNQGPGTTGEAPIYYLASLAAARGLPVGGENADANDDTDLASCLHRAQSLGLSDMVWMNESDLYQPSAGAPTLAQLGSAAHQLNGI